MQVIKCPDWVGNENAPEGSIPWCIALRNKIHDSLRDKRLDEETLGSLLSQAKRHEVWNKLTDNNDVPFSSFEQFSTTPKPYGLGIDIDDVERIIQERKEERSRKKKAQKVAMEVTEPAKKRGRPKKGEEEKPDEKENDPVKKSYGTSKEHKIAKLRRDHPDIADRLEKGEFKSVAAAERVSRGEPADKPRAVKSTLEKLLDLWNKASDKEKKEFLSRVNKK